MVAIGSEGASHQVGEIWIVLGLVRVFSSCFVDQATYHNLQRILMYYGSKDFFGVTKAVLLSIRSVKIEYKGLNIPKIWHSYRDIPANTKTSENALKRFYLVKYTNGCNDTLNFSVYGCWWFHRSAHRSRCIRTVRSLSANFSSSSAIKSSSSTSVAGCCPGQTWASPPRALLVIIWIGGRSYGSSAILLTN